MKSEDIYGMAAKIMLDTGSAGAMIILFRKDGVAPMFLANDGSLDGKVPAALRRLADSIEKAGGMSRKGVGIAFKQPSPNNPANS